MLERCGKYFCHCGIWKGLRTVAAELACGEESDCSVNCPENLQSGERFERAKQVATAPTEQPVI